ncbi:MAG: hypothetical protein KIT09_35010 [Bryobacteraceae bacterium]|nr:hypothetical protein [Bryobacteraceae bacterium]
MTTSDYKRVATRTGALDRRPLRLAMMACAGIVFLCSQPVSQAAEAGNGVEKSFWTIGVYAGPSPLRLSPAPNASNPVLRGTDVTDMAVDTVAHPFLVVEGSRYYMFFTAKDLASDSGGIGLAESSDGLKWKFRRTVIREPFVTSHPYVFQWRGEYYMIPEAHTETSVRLYKATAFPDKWEYSGDLIQGDHFISPTLARYKEMWWMFTVRPGNETLRLFYASDLRGRWTEHPLSPIVAKDPRTARPAGTPFVLYGKLYRLGQDCYPRYGYQVRAFEITDISPTTYSERMIEIPLAQATANGWNAEAMHHVDARQIGPNRWLALVDALGK